jgi:hypothetical protein
MPSPNQMDAMTVSMRQMHEKMMAAKTPEERSSLMKSHMALMKDGMAMMGQLRDDKSGPGTGGSMSMSPEMMGRRMDMMEMMMQMMVDREAAQPVPAH